jgi:hypothetical protein
VLPAWYTTAFGFRHPRRCRRGQKDQEAERAYLGRGLAVGSVRSTAPGFERPNPWVLNLRAQVQIGRDSITVRARPASGNELDRYWPRLAQLWPAYQTFYDRGGKRSVFVLEQDSRS